MSLSKITSKFKKNERHLLPATVVNINSIIDVYDEIDEWLGIIYTTGDVTPYSQWNFIPAYSQVWYDESINEIAAIHFTGKPFSESIGSLSDV